MNTITTARLESPYRTYKDINQGILSGLVKPRSMSVVTLTNEQRPKFLPVLRNHWACYMTGPNTITEFSFHVDGIIIRLWEKDVNGVPTVKDCFDVGLDMNLVWVRFEKDVKFGRTYLSDDSSTYQRFLSKTNSPRNHGVLTVARRDGISLMVRWLRRQERFILRQQELLMAELNEVGKALGKNGLIGYADYDSTASKEVIEKREAQASAIMTQAIHKALITRASRVSGIKVSEILDSAPNALTVKQSSMAKIEGGHASGVGNKGQLDSFARGPKLRKESAESVLRNMASRQIARAEKLFNEGNIKEAESLLAIATATQEKADAMKGG